MPLPAAFSFNVSILQINVSLKARVIGGLSLTSALPVTVPTHPLSLSTDSVTVFEPVVLYFQDGFFKLDTSLLVVSSPKSQLHLAAEPYLDVVRSINCSGNNTQVP